VLDTPELSKNDWRIFQSVNRVCNNSVAEHLRPEKKRPNIVLFLVDGSIRIYRGKAGDVGFFGVMAVVSEGFV